MAMSEAYGVATSSIVSVRRRSGSCVLEEIGGRRWWRRRRRVRASDKCVPELHKQKVVVSFVCPFYKRFNEGEERQPLLPQQWRERKWQCHSNNSKRFKHYRQCNTSMCSLNLYHHHHHHHHHHHQCFSRDIRSTSQGRNRASLYPLEHPVLSTQRKVHYQE